MPSRVRILCRLVPWLLLSGACSPPTETGAEMAVYVRVPGELRLPDWECPGQVADTIKLDGLGRGEWVGVLQPCPPTSGAVLVRGWVRLHRGTEPQVLDSYWPLGGEPVDFAAPVRLAEPIRHTVEVHGTILRLRRHPGLEVSTYRRQ